MPSGLAFLSGAIFHLSSLQGRSRAGVRFMYAVLRSYGLQRCLQERPHGHRSHGHEQQTDSEADVAEAASGRVAGGDPPLGGEQPQAIGEVPGGTENSQRVKGKRPGVLKLQLYFAERGIGMSQEVDTTKAQVPGVPHDVEKRNAAGPALGAEHPVAGPGIVGDVTFAAEPDVEAVKRVVKNRQPDPEQLEVENEGKARQQFDLLGVRGGATRRERVRHEMLDQECAYWNDPAEGVQLAKQE